MASRPCERFLHQRGALLGAVGYAPDPAPVERTAAGGLVFYHYTRPERLAHIEAGGGLYARLRVVAAEHIPELADRYLVEGLLQPAPAWLEHSQYFGDFGLRMLRRHVGDYLLRITLPPDFPGVYVAEMAHNFDCKYADEYGRSALNLGYDCRTGAEVTVAEANSYVPLSAYQGGHVLPNVKATRLGEGVVIPWELIEVCEQQPLRPAS